MRKGGSSGPPFFLARWTARAGAPTMAPMSPLAFPPALKDCAAEGVAAAWALETAAAARPALLATPDAAHMPAPGEVLIWLVATPDEAAPRALAEQALDEETFARIERLRDARARAASFAAHAGLRRAIAAACGGDPRALRFERGAHGKPALADAALHFSLSHTKGAAGFALARTRVGFDVERLDTRDSLDALAEIAFAEEMRADVAAALGAAKTALFYRAWTLGEAYIKATGLGISQGLKSFAFAPDDPPRLTRASPDWGPLLRWRFGVL